MEVTKTIDNDVITIKLSGRLDYLSTEPFEKVINEIERLDCILDMKDLEYISSSGLRCVLQLYKSTNSLKALDPNEMVTEVLDITGFTDFLEIIRTE